MKILVTGGAGYIGSITNWLLRSRGHETVIFDCLETGHREAVSDSKLIVGDLRRRDDIARVFREEHFDAVIHFAALALAGESMQKPFAYFHNNIDGGLNLLEAMREGECDKIIFSSTCAVYGYPKTLPVTETSPINPVSVYGASKNNFEEILSWYNKIYKIKFAALRYFNACGALPDGSLGEDHIPETHIIPVAIRSVVTREPFVLFGEDYDTSDGTCIRDYIHVLDLADAHIRSVDYLANTKEPLTVNLGVGKGYSNKEIIRATEKITGKKMNVIQGKRRWGDPDAIWADNSKARELLGWAPKYSDIQEIIQTAWEWHQKHPDGYK